MRDDVTDIFGAWVRDSNFKPQSVLVVGGSQSEPELQSIQSESSTFFCGIEPKGIKPEKFFFLDLEQETSEIGVSTRFDLVLCSQVLEHVSDLSRAIKLVCSLVSEDGYVFFGFPASNFPHGSPQYFSAGYPSQTVVRLLDKEFVVVIAGDIGSKKEYVWRHALREWPTRDELREPIRFIWRQPASVARRTFRIIRRLKSMWVLWIPFVPTHDIEWATESYVLARRSLPD